MHEVLGFPQNFPSLMRCDTTKATLIEVQLKCYRLNTVAWIPVLMWKVWLHMSQVSSILQPLVTVGLVWERLCTEVAYFETTVTNRNCFHE